MYNKNRKTYSEDLTIRVASTEEWDAIDRLAQRDSAPPPPRETLLVAEVDGEMLAAVSVRNGYAVADPFRPSGEHVELLRARADQLREGNGYRRDRGLRSLLRNALPYRAAAR